MIKNYADMANSSSLAIPKHKFKSKKELDMERVERIKNIYNLSHGKGKKSKKKKKKK